MMSTLGRLGVLVLICGLAAACQPQGGAGPGTGDASALALTPDVDAQLGAAYDQLSEGDKSTLATILQRPEALLLTTEGSPNDRFWTLLVAQAWAKPAPVSPEILEGLPTARSYGFVTQGREQLIIWLRSHLGRTDA